MKSCAQRGKKETIAKFSKNKTTLLTRAKESKRQHKIRIEIESENFGGDLRLANDQTHIIERRDHRRHSGHDAKQRV